MNFNDINYEVFTTSDGLPIGVKLLVVFEINNPSEALKKLNSEQIIPHIENIVKADMSVVVSSTSSTDFLKTNQTQIQSFISTDNNSNNSNNSENSLINNKKNSSADFYDHLQDQVKNKLHDDFSKYGIKLIRLNFETPKVLDSSISARMAEFSILSTETSAKLSVLERKYKIAEQESKQEAIKKQIAQQQENQNEISKAEAFLQAAKLKAEASLTEAKARLEAERLTLALAEKRAVLYDKHPNLLNFDLAKIHADSMKGINSTIISPELAQNIFWYETK